MQQTSTHPELTPDWKAKLTTASEKHYNITNEVTGDGYNVSIQRDLINEITLWSDETDEVIGWGDGRIAYHLPSGAFDKINVSGDYIVKLPLASPPGGDKFVDGKRQNAHEISVWNQTQSERLVPVTHSNENKWLIMPLGSAIDHKSEQEVDDWIQNTQRELDGFVASPDVTRKNIVIHNFKLKLCDYGYPPRNMR